MTKSKITTQDIFRANLAALMKAHPQLSSARAIAAASKGRIGQEGLSRNIAGTRMPKIDTIGVIASIFKLEAWQLLLPGLNPNKPQIVPAEDEQVALAGVRGLIAKRRIEHHGDDSSPSESVDP